MLPSAQTIKNQDINDSDNTDDTRIMTLAEDSKAGSQTDEGISQRLIDSTLVEKLKASDSSSGSSSSSSSSSSDSDSDSSSSSSDSSDSDSSSSSSHSNHTDTGSSKSENVDKKSLSPEKQSTDPNQLKLPEALAKKLSEVRCDVALFFSLQFFLLEQFTSHALYLFSPFCEIAVW